MSVADNVFVLPQGADAGATLGAVTIRDRIPPLHKIAATDIPSGKQVIKYGHPIGSACRDIRAGDWVHDHNVRPLPQEQWPQLPEWRGPYPTDRGAPRDKFMGYRRRGAIRPGVRNDIWVIPSVGCIRGEIRYILANYRKPYWIDSVRLIDHQSDCGGGKNSASAVDMLLGLAFNPNAAGILFVGLGCENLQVSDLYNRALAGKCNVTFAIMQKSGGDKIPMLLDELAADSPRVREEFPASGLCVGVIGSDGPSHASANPLLGHFSNGLASQGGTILAAGGPSLLGALPAIAPKITTEGAFESFSHLARLSGSLRAPSADDLKNGITTGEEKAVAGISIIGETQITGALDSGEPARSVAGTQITAESGCEAANCTAFAGSGAQVILFATQSGTPFGSVVPTVKISSHTELAEKHPGWIDFDAGTLLEGEPWDAAASRLEKLVLSVACGKRVAHEEKDIGDIALC